MTIEGEEIATEYVIWGAGIKPSPAAEWLGIVGSGGKVPVDGHLRVAGQADVYALGDTASSLDEQGLPLPALAQAAKQQGAYLGCCATRWKAART